METTTDKLETFYNKIEEYVKTNIDLAKLIVLEGITNVVSTLIARISVVLLFTLFVFIISIGVSLALGDMLGKLYYGFFIVSAFYLVAGILLHTYLHRWIKKPITDLILKQVN